MVDGAYEDGKAAQTVKAEATLARVDGLAQSLVLEEIGVRDASGERQPGRAAGGDDIGAEGANLLRQADHDHVTDLVAFDQAQDAEIEEASQGATRGHLAEADTTGEPGNGKAEAEPPFEAAVAQEMRIDGALDDRETQARDEKIFELFPDMFGVGFFVFHGLGPEHAGAGARAAKGDLGHQSKRRS